VTATTVRLKADTTTGERRSDLIVPRSDQAEGRHGGRESRRQLSTSKTNIDG